MKPIRLVIPGILLAIVSVVVAQEASPAAKEPVPDAPLMAHAPAGMEWTITYALKKPEKKPVTADEIHNRKMRIRYSPQILSKRVLKGPAGQTVIYTTYEAGLKSETWAVNGYTYELPFRDGEGIRVNPKGAGDFPEIYWVSAGTFRGTEEYKKRKVYVYETDAADPLEDAAGPTPPHHDKEADEPPVRASHRRACIDTETRLPVVVNSDTETMTYQFTKAPAEFPKIDPRITRQLKPGAE